MYNLDGCNFTATTIQVTTVAYFITYYIVLPYFITVGLILDVLLIIALVRQTKVKMTYGYQLQLACSRMFHCLTLGLYSCGAYWWGGVGGTSVDWFVQSYWLMLLTMKVLPALFTAAYILSLFISVAITCDRVYSLWRPLVYKGMNHRVHQSVIGAILLALATGMSVDKYFSNIIIRVERNGTVFYQYQQNPDYVSAVWGRASESVRVYVRCVCLIALIASNSAMIVLHQRRIKRIESMTKSNEERIQARRETNKELTVLAACQSALSFVDHVANTIGQVWRQLSPYWAKCSFVAAAEVNCTVMLASCAEFFLFVVVNRRLRRSIPGYKVLAVLWTKAGGGGGGISRVGTMTHS